jgi:hypothetical protein
LSPPSNRRQHLRLESNARILWCVVGTHDLQVDRLPESVIGRILGKLFKIFAR